MLRRFFQNLFIQKSKKFPKHSSLRHELPKPPVPQLQHTMLRYLQYAKVLSDGHKGLCLQETELSVGKFIAQCGFLQEKLEDIAKREDNWINDFWLSEMYLKVRTALPTNTNPAYVFPMQEFKTVNDQLIYAAWLIRGLAEFKNKVIRKDIDRENSTGREKVKMCMEQYDRILSCYREPQFGIDKLHYRDNCHDNQHIVVMCNNQAFAVDIKVDDQLLAHSEILYQLEHVHRMSQNRNKDVVVPVAGGSVGGREEAAAFWAEMKKEPRNVESLQTLKGAIFIVCLDSIDDGNEIGALSYEEQLANRGRHLINGFGSGVCGLNRWYDATIQLIVSSNGMNGLCIEHSVAEGIVIINMAESSLRFAKENMKKKIITEPSLCIQPRPLRWAVSPVAQENLRKQVHLFDDLASDLDMKIYLHKAFGKEFIKGCRVSPDGFVQLTLQLAYYKLHGHLVSSYESAAIRRFRKGRVDNIRANTPEALAWVKTMCDKTSSREQRRKAFEIAAQKQALVTMENITGNGIDNHLCALNVLAVQAVENGKLSSLPDIFKERMWTELMRFPLSTSQVTTSVNIPDTYLCYGPVVPDGYGCAYNILPDSIIFAASAFRSHPKTDAVLFCKAIAHSLGEIGKMLAA
ncbi:hypothetical protein QR680_002651 [Steinernema hermaphroditum]|uniref:Choline O-acetyltransferase n=1 Tax=Steinernema hermaphroditum TaxID=289476 RepID=A0AA39H3I7_9BILA|nr:hypothetical protein QR680_002651 [Steinernema hermaphroditum]